MLKDKLSEEELSKLRRSFEIIGDVVIIDIPEEIFHVKDEIIGAILTKHKHVKTILRKVGEVEGDYRIARYEKIYGTETETMVKEHGCRFIVDPTKVYYSVKLSGERERIARLVTRGERILVMFSGIGPYPIVIARLAEPSEVVGVEVNRVAVEYFHQNVKLNKVDGVVEVVEGDVREVIPKMEGEFDRILMPAPNTAESFVDLLPGKIKVNGKIHYYTFAGEEEEEDKSLHERVVNLFKENNIWVEVENVRICGHFAPYVHRYVLDLRIVKSSAY
jgi:tRNA (guanine37-N1)-methyltransferase